MTLTLPPTVRDDTVDVLHGVPVPDPYRYLEDPDSPRTKAFVQAQNELSTPYLAQLPGRESFLRRATALLTAPRRGVPWERGGRYFVVANPGDLDQDQLFTAPSLTDLLETPTLLMDPNTLSADGTVAMTAAGVSPDGRYVAYALSEAGSDWRTIRVRTTDGADLPDVLRWTKWVDPTWLSDGSGFFYWRYPEPAGEEFTAAMGAGKLLLHRLGTDPGSTDLGSADPASTDPGSTDRGSADSRFTGPSATDTGSTDTGSTDSSGDETVWEFPEAHEWMPEPWVSADGRWLVLTISPGTDSRTTVQAHRLSVDADGRVTVADTAVVVVGELAEAHHVVGSDGDTLYLRTERSASRGRLVAVDLADPDSPWSVVVPEHDTDVLVDARPAAGSFVLTWSADAAHRVEIVGRDGALRDRPDLPAPISVTGVNARDDSSEVFVGVTSFTGRPVGYRLLLDGSGGVELTALPQSGPDIDLPEVIVERRRAASADGTAVPMWVLRRADLPPGPRPTLLYGYGGFDIPVLPAFSALFAGWVAAGGVLAVANLRGGGEFGADWHQAGMLHAKQRVFDDFLGCATDLIETGVTSPGQLAVHGRSNGGLLVGAVMTQRPDLFAAALPTVGVLDMLRFQLFTIGWAWTTEYGTADDVEDFPVLMAYSPLHRLVPGTAYPATLICTGDHDDRVVPAHSLKFGAELQHCQAGPAPVLLRVDTRAGHGMGKPATALAAEYADQLAFAAAHTGLDMVIRCPDDGVPVADAE